MTTKTQEAETMSLYGVEGSVLIRRRQRLGLCHPWALTGIAQGGMNSTWHGYQHTRGGRVKAEKNVISRGKQKPPSRYPLAGDGGLCWERKGPKRMEVITEGFTHPERKTTVAHLTSLVPTQMFCYPKVRGTFYELRCRESS